MSIIPDFDDCLKTDSKGNHPKCFYENILYECTTALYTIDLL